MKNELQLAYRTGIYKIQKKCIIRNSQNPIGFRCPNTEHQTHCFIKEIIVFIQITTNHTIIHIQNRGIKKMKTEVDFCFI